MIGRLPVSVIPERGLREVENVVLADCSSVRGGVVEGTGD